jgi:hypothetical protein
LVNSHFTWLVEWPTWARLLYFVGWCLIFLITWPDKRCPWRGIVLAVWITLFIAACFSSVAHRPWIWPFPAAMLLAVLMHRIFVIRKLPRRSRVMLSMGIALGSYALLLLAAFIPSQVPRLRKLGSTVEVGSAQATRRVALCGNDRAILGQKVGHRLRSYVKQHPGCSITLHEAPSPIDGSYQTLVLVGDALEKFEASTNADLILLNPPVPQPAWTPRDARSVRVLWGDFNPSPAWYAWQQKAAGTSLMTLDRQIGEGLYLETWLETLSL